jgi:hypothetical protein
MLASLRSVLAALSFVCSSGAFTPDGALAQVENEGPPQVGRLHQIKQIALTEKQIQGVLAAQRSVDAINSEQPRSMQPDPKVIGQLDAVVRKNGLASYDEYNDVIYNIRLVLDGLDRATKKYVGSNAIIKQQIARVEADTRISANDKRHALAGLNMALKSPEPPIESEGNIELVAKYYDRLTEVTGDDED